MAFLRKYGVAVHIYIPIVKRAVVDFAVGADWTPAAGDVKISKDGGATANVTNLPSAIAMGNTAMWDFSMTATELQAATLTVTVADSATKAVEDQAFIIDTFGNASALYPFDLGTAVQSVTVATGGIVAASFASGAIDATAIAADAIGSSELAASAVTEIQSAILSDATPFAGANVAAIKTKTDQLVFTGANRVDASVAAINNNTGGPSRLDRSTRAIGLGTVAGGATTTSIPTSSLDPAASVADQFKGRILIFDKDTSTAALRGQASDITANTSGGTFTVTALTTAPASGDTFVIL